MPDTAELVMSWEPNTEAHLAGYRVKLGRATRFYNQTFDAGLPQPEETCEGIRIVYDVPTLLTAGTWFSTVTAYGTDGEESEPGDEVTLRVRPTQLQYSFDNVNWQVDRLRLAVFSNLYLTCTPPHHRILSVGNTHKLYRYLFEDEAPPAATVPNISQEGTYLQWDVPHPTNDVTQFNIYKKVNASWVLQSFAYPPYASHLVNESGEYTVSCVDKDMNEGEKSNAVIVSLEPVPPDYSKPEKPSNLRVIPN
jgi:hypothetical protein